MALLENITYSPGEPIQDMYDKINAAIDKINSVLGGGTDDQIISKVNSTDFNTQFVNSFLPTGVNLKIAKVSIGDWSMFTPNKDVAHGIADFTKILTVFIRVRNDSNTSYFDIFSDESATVSWDATNVSIVLSGYFSSFDFNESTSYNRGDIIIIYEG
jgi:hypothetical protein